MTNALSAAALATEIQQEASDPAVCAWVDASAGSGKTKVLTDRALRLMLAGAKPERILCLTFTKAAAAEMTNRIVASLARWTAESDAEVAETLETMQGRPATAVEVARAKTLFASVVDAPGGLKIQTVHAFCQAALERFPVEADAPPGFEALDERASAELMVRARDETLSAAMAADASPDLAAALDRMAERGGEDALDAILQTLQGERARLGDNLESVEARVLEFFAFQSERDAEAASAPGLALDENFIDQLRFLASCWRRGGKSDQAKAAAVDSWLEIIPPERSKAFDVLTPAFFTGSGEGEPFKTAATKAVRDTDPKFEDIHDEALGAICVARDVIRRAECALDTLAALRLAAAAGARYTRLKQVRAALDFDDLILKTRALLEAEGGAAWALYKLDNAVDHILVDEAQDTNPEQWSVIRRLADEFFREQRTGDIAERTVFAVGDPKQSIFSFQRADPREFERSKERFAEAAAEAAIPFRDRPLNISFRSAPAVLDVVDAVFAEAPAAVGVGPADTALKHLPNREDAPGRVEVWPLMPRPETEPRDPWTPLPAYPETGGAAEALLAEEIAAKIKALIDDPNEVLPPGPNRNSARRIQASDIMVVVQQRRLFGDALEQALKRLGVPTAGVDRLKLSETQAVADLIALAQAAALPEDDLSLAAMLKSPLGGLSEDALFTVANGRGRLPLWLALKHQGEAADAPPAIRQAWDFFREALGRADFMAPFDFLQWALGPMRGRARLTAAMGAAARDPIDALSALALRYAEDETASLTGFLAWMERETVETKRELEDGASGVRLMTAHASKGLQAPIVFLPDAARPPSGDRLPLFWAGDTPVLGPSRKGKDPARVERLREARAAELAKERRRLLYVAMTRAEDRLYIAGWAEGRNVNDPDNAVWMPLVNAGMDRLDGVTEATVAFSDEPALVYKLGGGAPLVGHEGNADAEATVAPPEWFDKPFEGPLPSAAPIAPSGAVVDDANDPPAALSPLLRRERQADAALRYGRGLLIHKLLERLPSVSERERERVGRAYLARAGGLTAAEAEEALAAVLSLLDDPAFGLVFAPDALAEAPIAGTVDGRRYAGVVDRLAVTPTTVTIVDFKTNRPPPARAGTTPKAYLAQMALYRDLAAQAFPGRAVTAALLWTEAPRLDRLDNALLDSFAPGAH